ncbi:MAG: hypothetical protein AAF842_08915, partial [Planctomycetota bacterium]
MTSPDAEHAEALAPVHQLRDEAIAALAEVASPDALEHFRIAYLGSKGKLKSLMAEMKHVPKDAKPAFGQAANALKQQLTAAFDARKSSIAVRGRSTNLSSTSPYVEVSRSAAHDAL